MHELVCILGPTRDQGNGRIAPFRHAGGRFAGEFDAFHTRRGRHGHDRGVDGSLYILRHLPARPDEEGADNARHILGMDIARVPPKHGEKSLVLCPFGPEVRPF